MEGITGGKNMMLTSAILLSILSVTVEAAAEESPFLEAAFLVEDFQGSDRLTAICPGTENDEIDLLVSKSQTNLNFSTLVLFRPAAPCQVTEPCEDSIPLQCSYCGYDAEEEQVFASISRQSNVEAYLCHDLKTNREQLYVIVGETTSKTGVYKKLTIALSFILGSFLLGVFAVLVKRCCAGNYPLAGTILCCLNKTDAEDSVTSRDDLVVLPHRSRTYTNGDVVNMDTCFSEIAATANGTNTQ